MITFLVTSYFLLHLTFELSVIGKYYVKTGNLMCIEFNEGGWYSVRPNIMLFVRLFTSISIVIFLGNVEALLFVIMWFYTLLILLIIVDVLIKETTEATQKTKTESSWI